MGIDFLFQLLGWATSSEKDNPFSGICKVLGLEYNLEETKLGTLIIKNTAMGPTTRVSESLETRGGVGLWWPLVEPKL